MLQKCGGGGARCHPDKVINIFPVGGKAGKLRFPSREEGRVTAIRDRLRLQTSVRLRNDREEELSLIHISEPTRLDVI
eukprot:3465260-Prorocentrum_lima.AAC.1